MSAHIINTFRSTEKVKLFIDTLLQDYNQPTYQAFIHILDGTMHSYLQKEEGWVPLPSTLIRKHWKRAKVDLKGLLNAGLIEVKVIGEIEVAEGVILTQTYSRRDNQCTEYRICPEILDIISTQSPKTLSDYKNAKYYNLMKGTAMKVVQRYRKVDENKHSFPKLVLDAMSIIESCPVNQVALEKYIGKLEADLDPDFGADNLQKARKLYAIANYCYTNIMNNIKEELTDGLITYNVVFKDPQNSGRLTEKGGMQACPREMKKVGFSNIPNIRNYDLKSSQVYGLIQWFKYAGISTNWLDRYLRQDKQVYADRVGISKDRWKECFMALVMAARITKQTSSTRFESTKVIRKGKEVEVGPTEAIIAALLEEANGDIFLAMEFYNKFHNEVAELKINIDDWQDWLIKTHVPLVSICPGGKQIIYNRAGGTFDLSSYKNEKGEWTTLNKLKSRLSAFLLQGGEAAYIHHLTWVSQHYGYKVLSNQHDGLVTIGVIPQAAMDYASRESGLEDYALLEEKEFC
ncbi:MAG: hypothetical protein HWQ44_06090 [Nostoc sp. JL34]|uniref:hypothetical protein n=1 Tax=Nostoc sp. JL34 TaxID=2815397 RepID=UPI001DE2ECF6|nr:hypothetical protein [Nostoc sp. JL34]MBN3882561.1 hypothetical protein [Nostoc sp. JL34]